MHSNSNIIFPVILINTHYLKKKKTHRNVPRPFCIYISQNQNLHSTNSCNCMKEKQKPQNPKQKDPHQSPTKP